MSLPTCSMCAVFGAVLRREGFERAVYNYSIERGALGLAEQHYRRSA